MIIGITGEAGAGKDTAAYWLAANYKFKKISFSTPLKRSLAVLLNEEESNFEDRVKKEEAPELFPDVTRREIMQKFGTEFVRDTLGQDAFIKLAVQQWDDYPHLVNSSVRFENEADWIREQEDGYVIHIKRPNNPLKIKTGHVSEKELEMSDNDFIVFNNGTQDDLFDQLEDIMVNIL